MYRYILSSLACFFILFGLHAQNIMPIGQWRSHLPYRGGHWVTQSAEKIYYATELSIFSIDKEDGGVDFMSKVDGLSNTGVRVIQYVKESDILIAVYRNAVIDLIGTDGISTMNQIQNFSNFTGEKRVFDLYPENDSMIYLAATYGVSKLNILAEEFVFTTFTGVSVLNIVLFQDHIYAATEEGIYRAPINSVNLDDFGNWTLLGPDHGFPADYSSEAMEVFDNKLYVDVNDTLYQVSEETLTFMHAEPGFSIKYMTAEGNHLLCGFTCANSCSGGRMVYFNKDGTYGSVPSGCFGRPSYGIEDEKGQLWFGDGFRNFRKLDNLETSACDALTFNSPYSEKSWGFAIENNKVWMAAGALSQTLTPTFTDHGFASFIDGEWTVYNRWTRNEMKGENPSNDFRDDDIFDVVSIAINPENGNVYAGSFLEGLVEVIVDEDKINLYNKNNSLLQGAAGDGGRVRISGLAFDENNNLWISNHTALNGNPIAALKPDGSWQSFNHVCNQDELFQVDIDENGYKWFVIGDDQAGVLVFDEGEMDDLSDDRCRTFTANNSNLPTNSTNCLVVDLDGDVWVGTTEGVTIFECGSSAFEPECQGSRRIVEQDGFGAFLLETEEVISLAVDGANRKWVGTKNGIFVLSPNGEDEVARFNTDNSPLFDNTILDIEINQLTGEVFIGTNLGALSYQSDAVAGETVNSANILVYPNPVRPEYNGPIAIKGLAQDANVKITDINGKLVFETKALGGQAIWDGFDYNGRRANSGVYLVFSTSNPRFSGFNAKPDAAVARILLVN